MPGELLGPGEARSAQRKSRRGPNYCARAGGMFAHACLDGSGRAVSPTWPLWMLGGCASTPGRRAACRAPTCRHSASPRVPALLWASLSTCRAARTGQTPQPRPSTAGSMSSTSSTSVESRRGPNYCARAGGMFAHACLDGSGRAVSPTWPLWMLGGCASTPGRRAACRGSAGGHEDYHEDPFPTRRLARISTD